MHNRKIDTSYPGLQRGMRRRLYMAPLLVLMLASLACNLMGGGDNPPTPAAATVPPAAATQPAVVTLPAVTQPPESLPGPTQPPTSPAVPTQPSAAAATETTAPLPVPQTGYLGDAAEQAGYFLAAAAVEDPYTPASFYPLSPGNKVVAVEITVGNQSGELITVNPFNSVLVDRDGTTHLPVAGGRADQLILVDLRPGQRVRGWVTFETPEAAVPAAVQYDLVGISDIPLEASLLPPPDGHTPAVPAAPASPAPLPRLGETVQQEGYSLSAVNVEDPAAASALYTPVPGRKLVAVEIVVGNQSGEALQLNPLDALLVDSEGYVYGEQLGGREGGELALVSLNPGETAQGWVAFSIPENAVPASVIYRAAGPQGQVYLETGVGQ